MVDGRAAGRRVVSPALVGRTEELATLAAAASSPPALVVLDGEAGIGKTRLVSELAGRPEMSGRRLLVGSCHRIRESFPLGPLVEALHQEGAPPAGQELSPVVGALRPLLPELAPRLPPAPLPLGDRVAERHRVFRGLRELIGSLGDTVLVLEDLHWADALTADFVGYLLAQGPPGLSLVLTYRGEEIDPRVRSAIARPPAATTRTDLLLAPLDRPHTGALAAAILGRDRVPDGLAAALHERSSGLPFVIEELVAALRVRGALPAGGSSWRAAVEQLEVPAGVRDPARERFRGLSAAARAATEAAAVLQVPVPVETLREVCQQPDRPARTALAEELAEALAEALASGLLAEHGAAVGFRHPLSAQAVYQQIPGPRRRELHRRAAAVLASTSPVPLGQVAHHLRQAGQGREWVAAVEAAADQALALGNDAEATRLLEDLLRHASLPPERRGRVAVRLGEAAIEAFRARDVVALLATVLDDELPRPVRGELRFRLGALLHEVGDDPQRARRLFAGAVADLADRPDLRAYAMVSLGVPVTAQVGKAEHQRWLQQAVQVLPAVTDRQFGTFLLGKIAMMRAAFGDRSWRQLAGRIDARTGVQPTHRREVNAYLSVGTAAGYAGHHDTAERMLAAGLRGAVAGENRRSELGHRSALALLRYCRGEWDGLATETAVLLDELAEHPRARIDAAVVSGCLALVRNELDGAFRALSQAISQCLELGGFNVLPVALEALLRLSLARGDTAEAGSSAARFLEVLDAKGVWAPDVRAMPAVVDALVASGQRDRAEALVARWRRELRQLEAPLAPAALGYAEAALAQAAGQPRPAAGGFAAAAARYEGLGCRYQAALAVERGARCRFDAGDQADAGAALLAARSAFDALGASWDHARTAQTARRHGVSLPAPHRGGRRGYGAELSPRERQVAELVRTGHSNKVIADPGQGAVAGSRWSCQHGCRL